MSVANTNVEQQAIDVVAAVAITVNVKLYDPDAVVLYYGLQRLEAIPVTDYAVVVNTLHYNTFTVTPTASLITKINAIIAGDPLEENVIYIQRQSDFLSEFEVASSFSREAIAEEFDKHTMMLQELDFRVNLLEQVSDTLEDVQLVLVQAQLILAQAVALAATMEAFGAIGENEVADTAAMVAAISYFNDNGGGTLNGAPGRTYYINQLGSVSVTKPLRINLNGATIKRPDGGMTAGGHRMMLLELGEGASFEVFNGTLDANYTGNPKPGGDPFVWQQNTTLYVEVADGANVPWVKFHDLILLDRDVFDHLRVAPGAGSTIDLLHVENVRSETANDTQGRADVLWYRGIKNVIIENCPYLHAVETEFVTNEDDMDTTITLRDATIGILDLLTTFTDYTHARKQCFMERLRVEDLKAINGAHFYTKKCDFTLAVSHTSIRPVVWNSEDDTFRVPTAGWSMANISTNGPPVWKWRRNKVLLAAGEAAPAANVYGITFPPIALATANKPDLTFEDCEFDLGDFDRIGALSGKITLRRNIYRCKGDYAFTLVTGSREQQVIIENKRGGFACLATVSLHFNNWDAAVATDYLELSGDWEDGVDKPITFISGTPNSTFKFVNRRTILGAALPAAAAIGDLFRYLIRPAVGASVLLANAWATSGALFRGVTSEWVEGSATYDPASLADGVGATTTVTVTGAALGDFVKASFSLDLQGITLTAWVSATNTVSVRFQNETGGVLDLASGTLKARVEK